MNAPSRASTGAPGTTGWPKTCTSPAVGVISPTSTRSTVVLPAPFGPEQADDLAVLDPEADVVDRAVAAGVLLDQRRDAHRDVGQLRVGLAAPAAGARCTNADRAADQRRHDRAADDQPRDRVAGR